MIAGWEGAGTGLGSSSHGIAEPIKGGELRHGEQKYLGVGHNHGGDDDDIFDQYRKQKSYTYQRSDIITKEKKPPGCFRCGKVSCQFSPNFFIEVFILSVSRLILLLNLGKC